MENVSWGTLIAVLSFLIQLVEHAEQVLPVISISSVILGVSPRFLHEIRTGQ